MPAESTSAEPVPSGAPITSEPPAQRPALIGVGLDARLGLPFGQLRAAAREAGPLGFGSLWTPAGGVPDSFHLCAAWSQDTELRTGISVVPAARMWTPPGLAAQAATLAQLSSGRFVLGVGTGGYGPAFWASVGLPNRPIAVMREYVTQLRALLAGQSVTASQTDIGGGSPGWPRSASLGIKDLPAAPVYLAALGPQMLRLAGETADGALLNWATPEHIAVSRARIAEGAARAGRDPGAVPVTMYIRVCVDDDVAAARRALGQQVLGYALGRPGIPQNAGYRGLFAQMGFDEVLRDLETRRDRGAPMAELVDAAPDQLLHAVGYYGPPEAAPAAFARLSAGLDEAIVRVITARPGLEPVVAAMAALTPALIQAAPARPAADGTGAPAALSWRPG
ncbi:MAG: LLM class flavin-dependent oxidoreductase [Actinomycetota bacterium]|nr:LLM class flavin-dependent oxidoreductase [Actinomycetota bacterium]